MLIDTDSRIFVIAAGRFYGDTFKGIFVRYLNIL
jgi:hypothetical protein